MVNKCTAKGHSSSLVSDNESTQFGTAIHAVAL